MSTLTHDKVIAVTNAWLVSTVIDLNLCPFARAVVEDASIRWCVHDSNAPATLLHTLHDELVLMQSSACVETTLIIHPHALLDFYEYNDFLDLVDALLVSAGFEGEFQVASFHPEYQFAGSDCSDAANFTNRSPFPMLHILRESSVARAVASHPNIDGIPETNIRILRELGTANLALRLRQCFNQ